MPCFGLRPISFGHRGVVEIIILLITHSLRKPKFSLKRVVLVFIAHQIGKNESCRYYQCLAMLLRSTTHCLGIISFGTLSVPSFIWLISFKRIFHPLQILDKDIRIIHLNIPNFKSVSSGKRIFYVCILSQSHTFGIHRLSVARNFLTKTNLC
jgi:hypothetical protein